ncbi:NBR1-Ig-like domain-containing protein [Sciscionella sediminilitoris]|uniref:NBR1-Ig-like domain-containing protein n=1 Tax=Sciscionella sediminilitoris TaxID=1445613 RepID=UPI00055BF48A|nr:NBR1-Ig-like domain-containing protein [Sciscionella sp. SE31]
MSERPNGHRPAALESFIGELVELRAAAGQPSFRRMAEKSGAVSHATLHQTVAGNRLQPWETVREFVRACEGDEEHWCGRWARARTELAENPAPAPEPETAPEPGPRPPRGSRFRWWFLAGVVLVLLACAATVLVVLTKGTGQRAEPGVPRYPGDASRFLADVTVPDGAVVRPGQRFVKVWEIRNDGSVPWHDRYLAREDWPLEPHDCRTPRRIPVGDTLPGERIKVGVEATAPELPGDCMVRWKMTDRAGRTLFPSARPVYFLVHVAR